jgi:GNAT superfamily N-acetyltransferase
MSPVPREKPLPRKRPAAPARPRRPGAAEAGAATRATAKLAIRPLTPERWPDLVALFGPRGACAGCWCTWWRLARAEWKAGKGDANRGWLERYVRSGNVPGLLAYSGGLPVGWVAVEPREAYPALDRSRTLARVDDAPVWSITCFFVAREHRGEGLTRALVEAAVRRARAGGARIVEAYPAEYHGDVADAWVYTGAASTFLRLGFVEVARRSASRPIVRKTLGGRTVRRTAARGGSPGARTAG